MASIKDVALQAGVSVSTVSNYLNQRRLRPGTAERVRQAIEKLNYSQNYAARSLVKGRSQILGLIVSDIENPFFAEIIRRFHDQALLMDMETILMHTNYDPNRTLDCVKRLIGLQVPGVAIMTSEVEPAISQMLVQKEISAVYYDLVNVGPWSSNITVDYETGIGKAIEHLVSLGHQRIGFISGPSALPSVQNRKQAFIDMMPRTSSKSLPIIDSDGSFQGGYYCCSKMLATFQPTAIICSNDLSAMGAVHSAHDKGLRIPDDLSLVGFDNSNIALFTEPALTSVNIPRDAIVRQALDAISHMMESADHQGQSFTVTPELIVRDSTAAPAD